MASSNKFQFEKLNSHNFFNWNIFLKAENYGLLFQQNVQTNIKGQKNDENWIIQRLK